MQYRRLGPSGLKLSALSFGSWVTFQNQVDDRLATDLMTQAYEAGVNFFDNAEVYAHGESERIMGRVLKELSWDRSSYCVSSKVFWGGDKPTQRGLSRKHIYDACHGALKRLQVDYLDLFFCHRPDLETPIEETVRAMGDLVTQGKILYWGTSEWSADEIAEAASLARALGVSGPTMEQPQYNLFHRDRFEREYQRLYRSIGLGTTIWSPLASGILTGRYASGIPEGSRMLLSDYDWLRERLESAEGRAQVEKATQLGHVAKDLGCSLAQLAIAWCLKNENVSTVILGASKLEQLEENLKAIELLEKLDEATLERIEGIVQNRPEPYPSFG